MHQTVLKFFVACYVVDLENIELLAEVEVVQKKDDIFDGRIGNGMKMEILKLFGSWEWVNQRECRKVTTI